MLSQIIDTNFDFRADSNGKDPDKSSPTLRKYHRILWSKVLPNGNILALDEKLHHNSEIGNLAFASDSIIRTLSAWKKYQHIIKLIPQIEIDEFMHKSHTIGGMLIFPCKRINNKATINGARGMHPKIKDRIDLTLECIKRYYNDEPSPLYEVLKRYHSFFKLFVDFKGYIDFFMLQDLVAPDYKNIKFFYPFYDFKSPLLPTNAAEYYQYKSKSLKFIDSRNVRISEWVKQICT